MAIVVRMNIILFTDEESHTNVHVLKIRTCVNQKELFVFYGHSHRRYLDSCCLAARLL